MCFENLTSTLQLQIRILLQLQSTLTTPSFAVVCPMLQGKRKDNEYEYTRRIWTDCQNF